ncbi:MAG TPA: hypothetical protein PL048_03155 [Leptospiraceae bacterium]|nr:hypothetical protein [Leptospiraceae bacterium]HMY65685.1 hypothetical protein [Leptospiraceae bacterium]HMZ57746.1 hypothetical protein [Leptospiraceae bacterium]HNF14073.1 hypothetical protein [Leptospiraceae bacterium]HNF25738.1 hypothetical protein [Leptospiraceae bacterium]
MKSGKKINQPKSETTCLKYILAGAFLFHISVLWGNFTWDDSILFLEAKTYSCGTDFSRVFTKPFYFNVNYFRPIISALYYFESCIYGTVPFFYKLLNLILFTAASGLVFQFFNALTEPLKDRKRWIPIGAASVWIIHPIQSELISQATNRFDLLMIVFSVLILLNSLKNGRRQYVLSFSLSFISILTKETAVIFPVLILFFALHRQNSFQVSKAVFLHPALSAAGILAALSLRPLLMGYVWKSGGMPIEPGDFISHILLTARTAVTDLRILLLFKLNGPIHYSELPVLMNPFSISELVLFSASAAFSIFIAFRKPEIGTLLACFWVSLLPVLQIYPIELSGNSITAERYLALPFFLLLSAGVKWAIYNENILINIFFRTGFIIFLSAEAVVGQYMHAVWNSSESLWNHSLWTAPKSKIPYLSLALIYAAENRHEKAAETADMAVSLYPPTSRRDSWDTSILYFNRANSLMRLKRFQAAEASYWKSIELSENLHMQNNRAYINLSICLLVLGRREESHYILKKLASENPGNREIQNAVRFIYENEEKSVGEFRN